MSPGVTEATASPLDPALLLGLPERARFSERLTKRMLREQFGGFEGRTPEGRLIDNVVASARVVGILRPETILVPAYRDPGGDEVTDIAVLYVRLAPKVGQAQRRRLVDLIQRAMPRPLVLFLDGPDHPAELALALTHVSRTDPEKRTSVVDVAITVPVADLPDGVLDIARRDRTDLWALYRDLVRIAASGGRPATATLGAAEAVRHRQRLGVLQTELAAVMREAKRAKSQQTRIALNTRAKTLRQQVTTVRGALYRSDSAQQ